VEVRDQNEAEGVLAVIGPAAAKVLAAAGLEPGLQPMRLASRDWRGVSVVLSRIGLGFEIWCAPDDALIVWDRLASAGHSFALLPAGLQALDTLEFESGVLRTGRDYQPARDGFTPQPGPHALGLCGLVDRAHFFNGRAAYLAAGPDTSLSGIVFDTAAPVPDGPVTASGRETGRAFASRWSPALRATAAFAVVRDCEPGTAVKCGDFPGRVIRLPFLPAPAAAPATETGELRV
jgi:aminomethyltransferase